MHGGAASSNELTWREIVEHHHSSMVDELAVRLDSDLQTALAQAVAAERARAENQVSVACEQARRAQSESLNQSLRRLRNAPNDENILKILSESCAPYAQHSVVLVFENHQARVAASSQTDAVGVTFDIDAAAAVVAAVESRDPVTALASETELSPELARGFAAAGNGNSVGNAYLFPLTSRHSVVAMLVASGGTSLVSAPVELLCEAAGMRLDAILPASESAKAPDIAQHAPARAESADPEDRKLHLQAQRMARVRVAEMRLYNERELREGAAAGNIYGSLKSAIDTARNQFLQSFLAKSPTMVDYLHLEILQSLAHGDDRLLGRQYPGPMV